MRILKCLVLATLVGIVGCESRDEARRKEVANNLKQVGKALEAYHAKQAETAAKEASETSDQVPEAAAPKAEGPECQADKTAKIRGVLAEFHRSPEGEIDGITLKDGTDVRFPPRLGEKIAATVSIGDQVEIFGWTHAGESEVHAAKITNAGNGTSVEVDEPPPDLPK